jgi:Lantibiotic dehydratase, N terminus
MASADEWRRNRWALVRVAALPVHVLRGLTLERTAELVRQADAADAELSRIRRALVDILYAAIGGCNDVRLRRWLLAVKRDLYNDRPLRMREVPADGAAPPPEVTGALATMEAAEREAARAMQVLETTHEEESAVVQRILARLADDDTVAIGLLLANPDVAAAAQHLAGTGANLRPSRREWRSAAVARYVTRAATRTTPFGAAAGAGVVNLDVALARPEGDAEWRIRPQVHAGNLLAWLSQRLSPAARDRIPLRVAPLRRTRNGGTNLEVPKIDRAPLQGSARWSIREFTTVTVSGPVESVLELAEGRTAVELVDKVAETDEERQAWRSLIDQLLAAGILEREMPRPGVDPSGLARLGSDIARLGDPVAAERLRLLGDQLAASTRPGSLRSLIEDLTEEHGPDAATPVTYHDMQLSGLAAAATGIDLEHLSDDLRPALHLAASTLGTDHHRRLTDAFLSRFGVDGVCNDVAGWLVDLLREPGFVAKLRRLNPRPTWASGPLGEAIRTATSSRLVLDPELFAALPREPLPGAVSAFVQAASAESAYRLVLNGLQSGRHKYLSRYLDDDGAPTGALRELVADLASDVGPVPVEVAPCLGINFQLHPPLTSHALEIPFEPASGHAETLPLADLRLTFDPATNRLRMWSRRLQRQVEPLHLGFLRDSALPDELILLRALSPRFGEEALSEAVDLYNALDWGELVLGHTPASHRPRIEVGRLVLERERWAVPMAEVPRPERWETSLSFFRRLNRWRDKRDLPQRGFVRRLSPDRLLQTAAAPRFYLDWQSPFVTVWLGLSRNRPNGSDWLIITEPLPPPEEAAMRIGDAAHVAELMVQFDRIPNA